MRGLLTALLALFLISCAAHRPPRSISKRVADRYGCEVEDIEERAAVLRAGLGAMETYIPQVGWTACELLAHNGPPTRVTYTQTTYGTTQNWWYEGTSRFGYVALDRKHGQWVVRYVSW